MSTESKLEIYKIVLGKRTFGEIIREKNSILSEEEKTDKELSNLLFKNVLIKLTQNSVWTTKQTKLGLALFSNDSEDINDILTCHSNNNVIEGYIDGGYYDKLRTIASTNDVTKREKLGREKIVTDRYYFYLHCPLGANVGLLFLEKKKGLSIQKAIELFMKELFKTSRHMVKIERFIPQTFIDEYKNDGLVDSFTFTDTVVSSAQDANGVLINEKKYGVMVKITLPNEDRPDYNSIQQALQILGGGFIKIGSGMKKLSDFGTKKGSLQKEDKKYNFILDEDLRIKPVIPINDNMQDETNSILKHELIKKMCDEILQQIQKEIYPVN